MEIRRTPVWTSDESYSNYRIPGILVTSSGEVAIWCEARKTSSDWAMMDILFKTSSDGGKTFGEPVKIARGNEKYQTVNNPVCMEDAAGTLHMLWCRDYSVEGGDVFHMTSGDRGKSWGEPEDIMASTRPDYHNVFACGPGHGIRVGSGRLLTPVWLVPKSAGTGEREHHPGEVSTLYSDDLGKSWTLGEILHGNSEAVDPNETSAAELDDGSVMLNMRTSGCGCRAVSTNKGGVWSEPRLDRNLPDPTCFGSIASYRVGGVSALLFVNCESLSERKNVVLKASLDGGKSWPLRQTIDAGEGGYCDVAVSPGGDIYVLYEQLFKNLILAKTNFENFG